jgi:hypothetical protein
MIYIKSFRELQKNILPESGKILELVKQPGQAATKKVIIHRRVRGVRREVFIFYYKPFLLCDLCALCGAKKCSVIFWQDFTFR